MGQESEFSLAFRPGIELDPDIEEFLTGHGITVDREDGKFRAVFEPPRSGADMGNREIDLRGKQAVFSRLSDDEIEMVIRDAAGNTKKYILLQGLVIEQ